MGMTKAEHLKQARIEFGDLKDGEIGLPEQYQKSIREHLAAAGATMKDLDASGHSTDRQMEQEIADAARDMHQKLAHKAYELVVRHETTDPEQWIAKMNHHLEAGHLQPEAAVLPIGFRSLGEKTLDDRMNETVRQTIEEAREAIHMDVARAHAQAITSELRDAGVTESHSSTNQVVPNAKGPSSSQLSH